MLDYLFFLSLFSVWTTIPVCFNAFGDFFVDDEGYDDY